MFAKKDTLKFDYDGVKDLYTNMYRIYDEAAKVLDNLENESKSAEDNMKGQYRSAYSEKSEEVFKELKKTVKNINKLSKIIEKTSNDFAEQEMIISDSLKK